MKMEERVIHAISSMDKGSGVTVDQIAAALRCARSAVSPRMAPLERRGVIERVSRRTGDSGRGLAVWRLSSRVHQTHRNVA